MSLRGRGCNDGNSVQDQITLRSEFLKEKTKRKDKRNAVGFAQGLFDDAKEAVMIVLVVKSLCGNHQIVLLPLESFLFLMIIRNTRISVSARDQERSREIKRDQERSRE